MGLWARPARRNRKSFATEAVSTIASSAPDNSRDVNCRLVAMNPENAQTSTPARRLANLPPLPPRAEFVTVTQRRPHSPPSPDPTATRRRSPQAPPIQLGSSTVINAGNLHKGLARDPIRDSRRLACMCARPQAKTHIHARTPGHARIPARASAPTPSQ